MIRSFISISLFLCSSIVLPQSTPPLFQIDLILFTHLKSSLIAQDKTNEPLVAPNLSKAIPLQNSSSNAMIPYRILSPSSSDLRDKYRTMSRNPRYQMLLHYTWLQPSNNQQSVALSQVDIGGWNIKGLLKIRKNAFYLLETELLFSAPNSAQSAFIFSVNQRLKPNEVYYFDHPQAGMLVKVHPMT